MAPHSTGSCAFVAVEYTRSTGCAGTQADHGLDDAFGNDHGGGDRDNRACNRRISKTARRRRAAEQALEHSIAVLFWPTIGAIATDVIGFGSLIASRVGPVHDFGIMTAIGALMVLVSAALVVPFLTLVGRFGCDPLRVGRGKPRKRP